MLGPHYTFVLERYAWGVRLLATQKPISRPGLVERKVCFISGPGNWCVRAADICPGYSLVIMQLTFPSTVLVSIRQLTEYGSDYYV